MRAVGHEGPACALGVLNAVTDEVHQGVLVWRAYGARNDAPGQAR
jgi:hypothetical protein